MRVTRAEPESRVNLTPMLDVVFIMLIFFVVTSTFIREVGIDASAPEPAVTPPPDQTDKNILVRIEANDQLVVDNRFSDPRAVKAHLLRLHAERPKAAVVIDAHPNSSTGALVLVMDNARAIGAEVNFSSWR